LSIYQLVIEKGTAFEKMYERGDFEMISDDLMADFYDLTQEQTCAKGLLDYEISNYARLGFESQHNLTYWRYGDYIGIGPGAHSRYKVKDIKIHEENTKNIEIYNKKISNQKKCQKWQKNRQTDSLKTISIDRSYKKRRILMKKDEFVEHVMMSLRLKEGLDLRSLVAPIFNYIDEEKISSLIKEGLCCLENNKLFLTKRGRPLHQAVLRYIL
jgi:oxygen-independent coproporphyrinogen-3 oxidase